MLIWMVFEGALLYANLFIRGAFRVQYRAVQSTNLNYAENYIT